MIVRYHTGEEVNSSTERRIRVFAGLIVERVEKLRFSVLQLPSDDDLAVPEAFGEDGDGGELVAALVGVVEDDDLRGGGNGS